jgi:aspartyl aminopeptidase
LIARKITHNEQTLRYRLVGPLLEYDYKGVCRLNAEGPIERPRKLFPAVGPSRNLASNSKLTTEFLNYVNASPSPYHVVATTKKLLTAAGFQEISEKESWDNKIQGGNKYFLTRNGSSIIAFAVGKKWQPGNGIAVVGAHTDSPCFRVKPKSKRQTSGYHQVGVETYGGGLWHTWFDRDLAAAGRVYVKHGSHFVPKLVKIDKPILRIPTLAIHLDRGVNDKLEINKETHMFPILGLLDKELNESKADSSSSSESSDNLGSLGVITQRHEPKLLELIAKQLDVETSAIQDFELVLYDTQKSQLGGINDEFVFSARLDNVCSSYCAVQGLIESVEDGSSLENESGIRLAALFDHEEIGSRSAQGADSNLLEAVMARLASTVATTSTSSATHSSHYETFTKSFLISADMAHGVHPNYEAKHEANHRPALNKGPVIKINANQRYATNSPGIILLQEVANKAQVPLQLFVIRNDSPCGSTIGPIVASKLGIRTLDIGNPQLSMHSVRETCGSADIGHAVKLFKSFYSTFTEVDKSIFIEESDIKPAL